MAETKTIVVMAAALAVAIGAGPTVSALAQPTTVQDQREAEGRIVNVNGDLIQLGDGTTVRVPQGVAPPTELQEGLMVKVRYETKNGQNVATSVQIIVARGGGQK